MKPFFNTPERIAALAASAEAWLGTPWCANSAARGPRGGVACHNLPRAIYLESGFLSESFPALVGDPNPSRFSRVSAMETWLDARPEFARLTGFELAQLQPGDLIGLSIGNCVNHLGVVLPGGDFIHVLMRKNTDLDQYATPPWSQRLTAVWRPVES